MNTRRTDDRFIAKTHNYDTILTPAPCPSFVFFFHSFWFDRNIRRARVDVFCWQSIKKKNTVNTYNKYRDFFFIYYRVENSSGFFGHLPRTKRGNYYSLPSAGRYKARTVKVDCDATTKSEKDLINRETAHTYVPDYARTRYNCVQSLFDL